MKIHVKTRLLYASCKCIQRLTIQDFITYRTATSSSGGTTGTKTRLVKKVTLLLKHCLKLDLEVDITPCPTRSPAPKRNKTKSCLIKSCTYKCMECSMCACRQLEAKRDILCLILSRKSCMPSSVICIKWIAICKKGSALMCFVNHVFSYWNKPLYLKNSVRWSDKFVHEAQYRVTSLYMKCKMEWQDFMEIFIDISIMQINMKIYL